MQTINWQSYFQSQAYPHDPDDYLVASDYYEDAGENNLAQDHRRRAMFWKWVIKERYRPQKRLTGKMGFVSLWGYSNTKEVGYHRLSIPFFDALPEDCEGITSKEARMCNWVLWYTNDHDAYEALYVAWQRLEYPVLT